MAQRSKFSKFSKLCLFVNIESSVSLTTTPFKYHQTPAPGLHRIRLRAIGDDVQCENGIDSHRIVDRESTTQLIRLDITMRVYVRVRDRLCAIDGSIACFCCFIYYRPLKKEKKKKTSYSNPREKPSSVLKYQRGGVDGRSDADGGAVSREARIYTYIVFDTRAHYASGPGVSGGHSVQSAAC